VRTLLLDNYDSYTYNLYQLLAEVSGTAPIVLPNDDPRLPELKLDDFDVAVISPGPGHPGVHRDFGHSRGVLEHPSLPVLGVCLGHQGLGLPAGAEVRPAPQPRHGHLTSVRHSEEGIFAGIPQGFTAVRYHSLCVTEPLPAELEALAWAEDGVLMGLRHRSMPRWGVQFHPESIATSYGATLIRNFYSESGVASTGRSAEQIQLRSGPSAVPGPVGTDEQPGSPAATSVPLRAHLRRLELELDTDALHDELYRDSTASFWLDSARVEPGLSRFSYLGQVEGPAGESISYRVGETSVLVQPHQAAPFREPGDIFSALERRLGRPVQGAEELPFELPGGYVGFFGYELKALCGSTSGYRAETPDAVWLRADRFVTIDHLHGQVYLVAVAEPDHTASALAWLDATATTVQAVAGRSDQLPRPTAVPTRPDVEAHMVRSRQRYLDDIEACQQQLRAGESYEICLTNMAHLPAPADDLEYYRRLRQLNPAPYSALVRCGELAVFSSSPERFLKVGSDRTVESKPIKGTAARSSDPDVDEKLRRTLQEDPKTRAENLMIVDLLRNDLGRVCEVGSVSVPSFMATESYATVHQLVSTIRGRLRPDVSTVQAVRACFPGGSMTGAPKLRTMEIIESLESEARGVYSGTLGFLAFSGAADLNIVIRTAVRWRNELSVGAGGAIVLDSDAEDEYDEMVLKAETTLRALPDESTPARNRSSRPELVDQHLRDRAALTVGDPG
jgi:para-aminobenzoate synthetase